MKKLPFVSVIIATFNDELSINFTLESICQAFRHYHMMNGEAELILISDGSTDKTNEIVKEWIKSYKIQNLRFFEQENQGVTRALQNGFDCINKECKYIIRMDADAFFIQENWLYKIVSFAELDVSIGGVGVTVVNPLGLIEKQGINLFNDDSNYAMKDFCPRENFLVPTVNGSILEVDYMAGTCACIRKTEWTIDTNYRLWTEDIDQSLTIRLKNKKNFILTELVLFHLSYGFGRNKRDIGYDVELATSRKNLLRISMSTFIASIVGLRWWSKVADLLKKIDLIKPNPVRARETIVYQNNQYFFKKWGFNEKHVDINYIKDRYRGTELCWRWDEKNKQITERILKLYEKSFGTSK